MLDPNLIKNIHSTIVGLANDILVDSTGKVNYDLKSDGTEVTKLDHDIHVALSKILPGSLLSEEGDHELTFPSFILDPIDGTRDLARGLSECALSLAYLKNSSISNAEGLIINPFTGFLLGPTGQFSKSLKSPISKKGPYLGLVSRSEFEKGLYGRFEKDQTNLIISPRGSIAFKLGLLASGACDFVITLVPKNLWDIAAGTALCFERGISLYTPGKEILEFKQIKYAGPLLWCRPQLRNFLWEQFKNDL